MRKFLFVSLILNLALVLAVGFRLKKESAPVIHSVAETKAQTTSMPLPKSAPEKVSITKPASDAPFKAPFNWRDVESPDYKIYIANLRGLHCPESTIADIIIADVNKYYWNKLAPYRKPTDHSFKFWKANMGYNERDPAYEKLRRDADKEKSVLLKDLLGKSYKEELAKASSWDLESKDPFYQNISREKKDQMSEIAEQFNEKRAEIYAKSKGGWQDEEDRQELKKIAREQTAALAKIFTPDELFEYQLRSSEAVQMMKWNELQGFDVTEEEFRAIAKARLASENAESGLGPKLAAEERAREVKEASENVRNVLGEERFQEMTLNQNYEYRNAKNIVEKLGGDKDLAPKIYALKGDLQKAVNQVRADKSLTREQRDAKLLAIRAEVDRTLTDALTERGYKAFKRNAYWIQDIARGLEKK